MLTFLIHDSIIDYIYGRTNAILIKAAIESSHPVREPKPPTTFKWAPILKPLSAEVKKCYHIWKGCGRPSSPNNTERSNLTKAPKDLRRIQNCITAQEHEERHREIMQASEDYHLFFKLISHQRSDGHHSVAIIKFKFDPENNNTQHPNWAIYFHQLAMPKDLPQFDSTHSVSYEVGWRNI